MMSEGFGYFVWIGNICLCMCLTLFISKHAKKKYNKATLQMTTLSAADSYEDIMLSLHDILNEKEVVISQLKTTKNQRKRQDLDEELPLIESRLLLEIRKRLQGVENG